MNVFTTDHPVLSQHWKPTTKKDARFLYWSKVLTVAFILCPVFVAVTWVGMDIPETPDVPDPSAAPSVLDVILGSAGFIISFPACLFVEVDEPIGLAQKIWIYAAVAFDGLLWAITTVSLNELLTRNFRRKAS